MIEYTLFGFSNESKWHKLFLPINRHYEGQNYYSLLIFVAGHYQNIFGQKLEWSKAYVPIGDAKAAKLLNVSATKG